MHKKIKSLIITSFISFSILSPYSTYGKSINSNLYIKPEIAENISDNKFIFLKGNLGKLKTINMDGLLDFFNSNPNLFNIPDAKNQLIISSIKTDELGNTHIKLHQSYHGIEVFNNELIVHINKEGFITAINGSIDQEIYKLTDLSKTLIENISSSSAISIAKKELKITNLSETPIVKKYISEINNTYSVIFEVNFSSLYPTIIDSLIYIDGRSGQVIDKVDKLEKIDDEIEQIEGIGVLGDKKLINALYDSGSYALMDTTPDGTNIFTHDGSRITTNPESNDIQFALPGNIYFKNSNKFNATKDKAAVDAHFYARFVYDYYKSNFNRYSIDNKGKNIISTVHLGKNWCNALWTCGQMIYGDGDGKTVLPLSGSLDFVAHEITHGVQQSECNLNYFGQSGALNESFSDVFGTIIESAYKKDNANYMIGEDVWKVGQISGIRDMENPDNPKLSKPQAAHMNQYKDLPKSQDNGGVHYNSGIPNKAAYLIMKTIGHEKTAKIYYHTMCSNLPKNADFKQARLALLLSASTLYGENSKEYKAIENAFNSVGII